MAGGTAERGEDAVGGLHAADVLRAGLAAHQDDAAVGVAPPVGAELLSKMTLLSVTVRSPAEMAPPPGLIPLPPRMVRSLSTKLPEPAPGIKYGSGSASRVKVGALWSRSMMVFAAPAPWIITSLNMIGSPKGPTRS